MSERVSPQSTTDVSKAEFFNNLIGETNREKRRERQSAEEKLINQSENRLKYSDIGFVPGVIPLRHGLASAGNTVQIQVPDSPNPSSQSLNVREKYGIFEKNEVLIQGEFNEEPIKAYGRVIGIADQTIAVNLTKGTAKPSKLHQRLPLSKNVSLGVILNPVPFNRRVDAIKSAKNHSIAPYLVGNEEVEFSHQREANTKRFDEPLYRNDKQKEGIEKALQAEEIACLQGPPGTGKTRVIIELIRRLASAGNSILVAAQTHAAIDNILVGSSGHDVIKKNTLLHHYLRNDLDVARTNVESEKTNSVARSHFAGTSPQVAQVVVSTHGSAAPLSREFDYVIVDEATQATIPSSLISVTKGDVCILVGDHKQLPPFSRGNVRKSLFEHLYAENGIYGSGLGVRFNVQYRMRNEIAQFSSKEFYNKGLESASTAGRVDNKTNLKPIAIFDIPGNNEEGSEDKENPKEAKFSVMQVKMLLNKKGFGGEDVGVAAAYSKQAKEIKQRIDQSEIQGASKVKVDTFDSFQGSERAAMVLSFTRSNDSGTIGFLGDDIGRRRLNVALTRAKRYCALIGDWETLCEGSALYRRLYKHVDDIAPAKEIGL